MWEKVYKIKNQYYNELARANLTILNLESEDLWKKYLIVK